MLDNNTVIKVTNRDNSYVGYIIPELNNLRRKFAPNETKEISMGEIRKLSWTDGGKAVIKNHLILQNEEAVREILINVEPEYFYDSHDVERLLTYGTLDQVKDALDFAPEGVVALMKDKAVETKLNDVAKREAIKAKTHFDVTKAIEYNEISNAEEAPEVKVRRSAPMASGQTATDAPARRTAAPTSKYKVTVTED